MAEKSESKEAKAIEPAVPVAPLLVKTVVSTKATIPLVQYGNLEMFISQEFYTEANAPDSVRSELIQSTISRLKTHLAEQVAPMVEPDVIAAKTELAKQAFPDSWMQRNNAAYRWLRVCQPDMKIAAMQAILDSRQ
jgi:hypothetical protein